MENINSSIKLSKLARMVVDIQKELQDKPYIKDITIQFEEVDTLYNIVITKDSHKVDEV